MTAPMFQRRALLVEDHPELFLRVVKDILPSDAEWEVLVATSVDEALECYARERVYDLVIVDFKFPESDGRAFLRALRKLDRNVPVLLFSEYPDGRGFSLEDYSEFNALQPFINKSRLQGEDGAREYESAIRANYNAYIAERCAPQVFDEYGLLESVLVHAPSAETECIDPAEPGSYLFEGIPRLVKTDEQHAAFVRALKRGAQGPIVLEVARLLFEILRAADLADRRDIIEAVLLGPELRTLRRGFSEHLKDLSPQLTGLLDDIAGRAPDEIVSQLLRGVGVADFRQNGRRTVPDSGALSQKRLQLFGPTANLYFTRDPAFTLGASIVLSKMYWPARRREPSIFREIFNRHPFMKHARHTVLDLDCEPMTMSVEGGDAMAIQGGVYAIAESERTNRQAVRMVAEHLFERSGAEIVYQPSIPVRREFIHLDTVCSLAGPRHVVAYPEALNANADVRVWTRERFEKGLEPQRVSTRFVKILNEEYGRATIHTANGGPLASQDQFDDATNVFMASSTTAVAYDRNRATNEALLEAGLVLETFTGDDLVLGRGGPRCMTMPLRRSS